MRLILAANARIPSEYANAYQAVQMCEALAEAGANVTLVYGRRGHTLGREGDDIWAFYDVERNFRAERLGCLDLWPLSGRLPQRMEHGWRRLSEAVSLITYTLALVVRIAREREAVVCSRDTIPLWLIATLWPKRARRLIFEAHTSPATRLGRWLRRALMRRVGGVVAVTAHLGASYAALGARPCRLLVAHDGVRERRFRVDGDRAQWRARLGWPVDAFIVGYAGRFSTMGMDKGIGDLADAVAALACEDCRRPIRLALVGGPAERVVDIRRRFTERGLPEDLVLYPGQVPPAEIPGYLRALDVGTLPFPWTEHFAYCASPLKLFEYMAAGTPILASALPAIEEIVRNEENGLLTPPGDVGALVDALRRLRDDTALGERLARHAVRDVVAYRWTDRARRILDLIRSSDLAAGD